MNRRSFLWFAPGVVIPGMLWAKYSRGQGEGEVLPVDVPRLERSDKWARTSWIGNTYADYTQPRAPDDISHLFLDKDGRVNSYTFYVEMGTEMASFDPDTGQPRDELSIKDRGAWGGMASAFNQDYVWVGYRQLTRPNYHVGLYRTYNWNVPKGMKRYDAAPFAGGVASDGAVLSLKLANESTDGKYEMVSGAVASTTRLYVSDRWNNVVRIYNANTMAPEGTISAAGPKQMTLDGDGNLWVISGGTYQMGVARGASIRKYGPTGTYLGTEINESGYGVAYLNISWDAAGNRLMVCDDGWRQQIRYYNTSGNLVGTFGVEGGVYAGTEKGLGVPLTRLYRPNAAVADASGNIYVNCHNGGGADLRAFTSAGALKWHNQSRGFVVTAVTPKGSDASDVALLNSRLAMNWSQPPGQDWSFTHYTVHEFAYPGDLRAGSHVNLMPQTIRTLPNRETYMFMTEQEGRTCAIFLRVGGLWKPCVMFSGYQIDSWAPQFQHQPYYLPNGPGGGSRGWQWRDQTGTVPYVWRPEDFVQSYQEVGFWEGPSYEVDSKGDIWHCGDHYGGYGALKQLRLQGFDAHKNPLYEAHLSDTTKMRKWNPPAAFGIVRRAQYFPDTDTLYLTGYRNGYSGKIWPRIAGDWIARYDGWLASNGTVAPTWSKALPFDASYLTDDWPYIAIQTMDVAGDRIILGYATGVVEGGVRRDYGNGRIASWTMEVWDLNGNEIGNIIPGPEVGGNMNWIDSTHGLRANYYAGTGVYTLFGQDVTGGKVLVFRGKLIAP